MTLTSYGLGRSALALWRKWHGEESLNQQCIRYDGYYWQWAYQGDEAIREYRTATAAADDSPMYTRDVNDPNAQPGDLWYWWWATDGHVGTVLGHDANGRVLVTHTSSSGDLVEQWSNNVRISHADTIPHQFRGGSHHYGVNLRRADLDAWQINKRAISKKTKDLEMRTLYNVDNKNEDTRRALVGEVTFKVERAAVSTRSRKLWGAPENVTQGEWDAEIAACNQRRRMVGLEPLSGTPGEYFSPEAGDLPA